MELGRGWVDSAPQGHLGHWLSRAARVTLPSHPPHPWPARPPRAGVKVRAGRVAERRAGRGWPGAVQVSGRSPSLMCGLSASRWRRRSKGPLGCWGNLVNKMHGGQKTGLGPGALDADMDSPESSAACPQEHAGFREEGLGQPRWAPSQLWQAAGWLLQGT